MIPNFARYAARTPAAAGIAMCSRFTDPPACVYSARPPAKLPAIRMAWSSSPTVAAVPDASGSRKSAAVTAAPNGPAATGVW